MTVPTRRIAPPHLLWTEGRLFTTSPATAAKLFTTGTGDEDGLPVPLMNNFGNGISDRTRDSEPEGQPRRRTSTQPSNEEAAGKQEAGGWTSDNSSAMDSRRSRAPSASRLFSPSSQFIQHPRILLRDALHHIPRVHLSRQHVERIGLDLDVGAGALAEFVEEVGSERVDRGL